MLNLSEPGVEEFDNFTTPMLGNESFDNGNESLLTEEESFDTGNESFDDDEKNLVLRVLNTNDAKYEMPFSKNKGGFRLDADEFRVKVIGGKGKIQAASMAEMLGDGKVDDKEFLDKERRNGNVYFNMDEIEAAKYLLEVYIKLSDGSIGTWARDSVTVTN
jgi:hypothetical protein